MKRTYKGEQVYNRLEVRVITLIAGKKKTQVIRYWAGKEKPDTKEAMLNLEGRIPQDSIFTPEGVENILHRLATKLENDLPELEFRMVELGKGRFNLIGEPRKEMNHAGTGESADRGDGGDGRDRPDPVGDGIDERAGISECAAGLGTELTTQAASTGV